MRIPWSMRTAWFTAAPGTQRLMEESPGGCKEGFPLYRSHAHEASSNVRVDGHGPAADGPSGPGANLIRRASAARRRLDATAAAGDAGCHRAGRNRYSPADR